MGINYRRVFVGGLLAAVVIILSAATMVPVVGDQLDLALARFDLPPLSASAMVFFAVVSLTVGLAVVWLYAALQPRLRSGPLTAIKAALFIWLIFCFFPNAANVAYGFMPVKLTVIGILWGLFELVAAALIGSRFYHDRQP